jgi:competence protein ComEA
MLASRIRVSAIAALVTLGAAALAFGEGADAPAPSKKVNINTASPAELAYLPRIGASVAARIVERRKEKPFARPEDLMEVKGVGELLFLTLKPYVSVSGPTTLDSKVRLSSSPSAGRASSPAPASAPKEKPANAVPLGKGR